MRTGNQMATGKGMTNDNSSNFKVELVVETSPSIQMGVSRTGNGNFRRFSASMVVSSSTMSYDYYPYNGFLFSTVLSILQQN